MGKLVSAVVLWCLSQRHVWQCKALGLAYQAGYQAGYSQTNVCIPAYQNCVVQLCIKLRVNASLAQSLSQSQSF